tara:strand:- start:85 stop:648 length:564 start_codon:yes stop_codon:yes gene_type:complete
MLVKKQIIITALLSALYSSYAAANLGFDFSSGEGIMDIKPYRLGVSWDFGSIWREEENWGLNAIWESSVSRWDRNDTKSVGNNNRMDVVTTGPMFRWQRQAPFSPFHIMPYLELGVGASWLSDTEIGGRRLSLHFQFEDKVGIGVRFGRNGKYDLSLRGYHYSNASLKRPNSGVNLAMISFGYWLDN